MTIYDILQIVAYLALSLILVKPLGLYMACIYDNKPCYINTFLGPLERGIYRLCGIEALKQMNWKSYAMSMLLFNVVGILLLYAIQRGQYVLPLNPENFKGVNPDLAFNTALSFVTNTNWQAYSGESTLSYFTQMVGLTVQNFMSAATGMSILIAFIRGLRNHESTELGNFWVDITRGILYILLPLAIILSLLLVSQGVIQNFKPYETITLIQPLEKIKTQTLPMGPAASQVAIKQLGSNGGGFFNANSAHPFENPSPLSNFLEMLAIILIPAALCYTFGVMIKNTRQGFALLIAMTLVMVPLSITDIIIEKHNNPFLMQKEHITFTSSGNMEGKETRFGAFNSALWASVTTATANGSVNASLDSFLPLGGLIPLWLIDLGEVIFGGVGSGLYQMLIFVILTVFVCGLMVGRTPEYLGKKIEIFEMKMASFAILIMPMVVLLCSAFAVITDMGKSSIMNPGMHGLTEILYAFSSMTNNNGSAFAGLNANTPFYNTLGGVAMLIGRYWIALPVLAIAGSLSRKKVVPLSAGTLTTDSPLFVLMLICIVLIIGALTFLPVFALGPIVEQLGMP